MDDVVTNETKHDESHAHHGHAPVQRRSPSLSVRSVTRAPASKSAEHRASPAAGSAEILSGVLVTTPRAGPDCVTVSLTSCPPDRKRNLFWIPLHGS